MHLAELGDVIGLVGCGLFGLLIYLSYKWFFEE